MPRTVEQIQFTPHMPKALRVAAYARVSCGKDAMLHSLAAQVDHYSTYIRHHPGWEYVGVYADMYNRILIQCPPHRSVEKWLKQRLSADLNYLPKAFFFVS